jgi:hypothetical protein
LACELDFCTRGRACGALFVEYVLAIIFTESFQQVARASPEHFWPFSLALFKAQEEYFDIPTSTKTPLEIRASLRQLAETVIGDSKSGRFADLLTLKSAPNGGVDVTDDLKYTSAFDFILEVLTDLIGPNL